MRIFSRSEDTKPTRKVTEFFDRFGARGAAIILTAEVIWIASILVPVLTVIGLLFSFTNAWMSVLPGFIGALTFILVLAIGALAAAVPSNYVAKWRERVWRWMEDRHPEPRTMATPIFPPGLDIQDAD